MQSQAYDWLKHGAMQGQQQQRDKYLREWENQDKNVADQNAMQRLGLQHDFTQQQAEAQRQSVWESQSAADLDKETGSAITNLIKQKPNMTPEGQRLLGDLAGKFRSITKQRTQLRPAQYGSLLGQFREELQNSGIDQHIQTPQTIDDFLPKQTKREEVRAPDGSFMGYNEHSMTMRNGSPTINTKFIPHKPDLSLMPQSFEQRFRDSKEFDRVYAATSKELFEQAKIAAGENPEHEVAPPSSETIIAAMRLKHDLHQKTIFNGQQQAPQQAPSTPKQINRLEDADSLSPGEHFVLPNGRLGVIRQDGHWSLYGSPQGNQPQPIPPAVPGQGDQPQPIPPPQPQPPTDTVSPTGEPGMPDGAAPPQGPEPGPVRTQPVAIPPAVSEKHAAAVDKLLPHPKSPAEAAKLPPGTRFVKPNGTIGVRP